LDLWKEMKTDLETENERVKTKLKNDTQILIDQIRNKPDNLKRKRQLD